MKIRALLALLASAVIAINGAIYPTTMVVTNVDTVSDTVTIRTFTGIEYEFCGTEDWIEGDIASCLMYDNGTSSILDDRIMVTRYSGWVDHPDDFLMPEPKF